MTSMANSNVQTWIDEAKAGNQKACKSIYECSKHELFLVCQRYASGSVQAEDFLQEAFIKIFKNLHQYNPELGVFMQWARKVTINVCLSALRAHQPQLVNVNVLEYREAESINILSAMSAQEMLALVQELPKGYRTVFNMYVIDGYSHKEIAEKLGIAEGTSKTQLMKARASLQQMILKKNNIALERYG
jgi:RNA polymerase sigma factor (sigma-70 family)